MSRPALVPVNHGGCSFTINLLEGGRVTPSHPCGRQLCWRSGSPVAARSDSARDASRGASQYGPEVAKSLRSASSVLAVLAQLAGVGDNSRRRGERIVTTPSTRSSNIGMGRVVFDWEIVNANAGTVALILGMIASRSDGSSLVRDTAERVSADLDARPRVGPQVGRAVGSSPSCQGCPFMLAL